MFRTDPRDLSLSLFTMRDFIRFSFLFILYFDLNDWRDRYLLLTSQVLRDHRSIEVSVLEENFDFLGLRPEEVAVPRENTATALSSIAGRGGETESPWT